MSRYAASATAGILGVRRFGYYTDSAGAAPAFSPLDLTPALWVDPSDASSVTISGSSGAYIGADGLVLAATNSNSARAPHIAAYNVTNCDVRVLVNFASLATSQTVFSKRPGGRGTFEFYYEQSTDRLILDYVNAAGTVFNTVSSNASPALTTATDVWLRATRVINSGGNDLIDFYKSSDGVSWTPIGTQVSVATTTTVWADTSLLEVGSFALGSGRTTNGIIKRAVLYSDSTGSTKVFDADFESATPFVSAFTESALGAPVYVVSSTATSSTASYGYVGPTGLVCPGAGTTAPASTPDTADRYEVLGDLDVIVKVAAVDWTPATTKTFIGRSASSGQSWWLTLQTSGTLGLSWVDSAAAAQAALSSVATGLTDGATKWVRATLDVNNGASGCDVKFYLSDDGASWTQLGTTQTQAFTTDIRASTNDLRIGSRFTGTDATWAGTIMRAIVKNGIDGTTVFDADFVTAADYCATFTEAGTGAGTVTIDTTNTPANAAGACVSQINDLSGNARHLTQGTLANMPKYWNGRNGLNVLVFDGASDSVSVTWAGLANNFFSTVFARVNDTGGSKVLIGLGNDLYPMWFTSAELLWGYITAGGVGSVAAANRVVGSTCITDMTAAAPRQWLDGVLASAASTSSATGGTFNLGQGGISNIWYSGECGEVVVNLSAPAAGDITSQQSYVKTKWGTP